MNEMDVFASFFSNSYMEDNYASNQFSQQFVQSQQDPSGEEQFNPAVPLHQQIYVINEDSQENASHHLIVNTTEDNQTSWNNQMQISPIQQPTVNAFQELFERSQQAGEQASQQEQFRAEPEVVQTAETDKKNLRAIEDVGSDNNVEQAFQQKSLGEVLSIEKVAINNDNYEEVVEVNEAIISNSSQQEENDQRRMNSPKDIAEVQKKSCLKSESTILFTPNEFGQKDAHKPLNNESAQVLVTFGFNSTIGTPHTSHMSKNYVKGNLFNGEKEERHQGQQGQLEFMIQNRAKTPIKQFLDFDQESLFSVKNQSQKSSKISKYSAQPTRSQVGSIIEGVDRQKEGMMGFEKSFQNLELLDKKGVFSEQCYKQQPKQEQSQQIYMIQKQNLDQQKQQPVIQGQFGDGKQATQQQGSTQLENLYEIPSKEPFKIQIPQTSQPKKEEDQQELKQIQPPYPLVATLSTDSQGIDQKETKPLESIMNSSSGTFKVLQPTTENIKDNNKECSSLQKEHLDCDKSSTQKKGFRFQINMDSFQHVPKQKLTTQSSLFEVTQRQNSIQSTNKTANEKENSCVSNRISTLQTEKPKVASQKQPQKVQLPQIAVKKGGFDFSIPQFFGNASKTVNIKREKRRPSTQDLENAAINQAVPSMNNSRILSLGTPACVNSITEEGTNLKQPSNKTQMLQQQKQMFQQQNNNQQQMQLEMIHKQKQQQQLQHGNSLSPVENRNPLPKPQESILKVENCVATLSKKLLFQMAEFERLNKHLDIATLNSCEQKWEAQFLMEQQADLLMEIKDSVTRLRRVQ